jgi:hypothetical protein
MKTWHYYGVAAIVGVLLNRFLDLLSLPRIYLVSFILFVIVARLVHQWQSGAPAGEDPVKEARERDRSWTDAEKKTLRELLKEQRQQ